MKRSEMIDRIHMFMCDHQVTFKYAGSSREMAEKFLMIVEESGMQPPQVWVGNGCLHTMREICDCSSPYENGWEK